MRCFSRCAVCTAAAAAAAGLGEGAVLPLRPQGAAPALSILHQALASYWSTWSPDQIEASHWSRASAGPQPRPLTGRELSKVDIRTSKDTRTNRLSGILHLVQWSSTYHTHHVLSFLRKCLPFERPNDGMTGMHLSVSPFLATSLLSV